MRAFAAAENRTATIAEERGLAKREKGEEIKAARISWAYKGGKETERKKTSTN